MIDFVSAFFSWGKEKIEEPIDPRVEEEKPKRKKLNKRVINEVKQEEE